MRPVLKLFIALIVMVFALGALVKLRDVSLQHKLTGTWVADFPDGDRSQWSLEPDGSYSAQLTSTNGRVINLEGAVKVKYGYMHAIVGPRLGFLVVDTCTKSSETNAICPYVSHYYIAKLADRELVINTVYTLYDASTFRKTNR